MVEDLYSDFPTTTTKQTLGSSEPSSFQGRPSSEQAAAWDKLLDGELHRFLDQWSL
jgi:hypothetical protein